MPHVNGLRAVAILGVLLYHLHASYCPAGYFGVDLFLVISGFLLFRSLLKPGAEQSFHYGSYLLKKAWRIIPSWFVATLVITAASLYFLNSGRMGDVLKVARHSALYYADYYIDRSGDYFNIYSQQNPLLHYWYLSVISQLYIIAPLLIIPLARWVSRRASLIALVILAALSFVYYVLTTTTALVPENLRHTLLSALGTKTAYYHLVPRFWEIAAGAGIVLLPEFSSHPRLRGLLGLTGLIGIIASFYLYETGSPAIYLAVASSLLALRYASSGFAARLLTCKPIQALGTISFSLYLWHWPVMVFWKYYRFDAPGAWDEVGMLILSLLLGLLSWYTIERLCIPSRTGWKGTLLRCSLLLCIPLIIFPSKLLHKNMSSEMHKLPFVISPEQETCPETLKGVDFLNQQNVKYSFFRIGLRGSSPEFILIGDSHAAHIYDALHKACRREGMRGVYLSYPAFPYWNYEKLRTPQDEYYWNEELSVSFMRYLEERPNIRYVLIGQFWTKRMTKLPGKDWSTGREPANEQERIAITTAGLGEFCDRLRAIGKVPILFGDTPSFDEPSPWDEWQRCQQLGKSYNGRHITVAQHDANQALPRSVISKLAVEGRAHYIDLAPALRQGDIYPDRIDGEFLYRDTNHLFLIGSQRAIDAALPQLVELMGKDEKPE